MFPWDGSEQIMRTTSMSHPALQYSLEPEESNSNPHVGPITNPKPNPITNLQLTLTMSL